MKPRVLHSALRGCECGADVKTELDTIATKVVSDVMTEMLKTQTRSTVTPDDVLAAAERVFSGPVAEVIRPRVLAVRHRGRPTA